MHALVGDEVLQQVTLAAAQVDHRVRTGSGDWRWISSRAKVVERDARLNRAIGCDYHVQHISSAGSVEIVRRARALGLNELR